MAFDALGGGRGVPGGEFQSPALERLVRSLQGLPGLGRKSATRLALHLLDDGQDATELLASIAEARERVTHCSRCGAITEADPCAICTTSAATPPCSAWSPRRSTCCPSRRRPSSAGRYFVLGGLLSPLDGVRAEDLPFERLVERIDQDGVREVILALDTSVEGETTALYVQRLLAARGVNITRLATGIPMGSALAYTDEATLQRAFQHRTGLGGA